jgi:hypothetical protein
VEANAPIAQHREEMKQNATNAEASKDRHALLLDRLGGNSS